MNNNTFDPLSWWWSDRAKVDQLSRHLVQRGILKTAPELLEFQANPHHWNREYQQMMDDLTASINVVRPATEEWFDDRFYPIVENDPFESITTILAAYPAPELVRFMSVAGNVEAELRKRVKGDRGSRVHDALQQNKILVRSHYDQDEWLMLMYAKMFHDQYKPQMILNEQWCWSHTKHYAGRFDRIVLIDGKVTLIDWKTGFVGREAWLQLAAEKFAIEESYPFKIERWGIVSLNAKVQAGWKFYTIEERDDVKSTDPAVIEKVYRNDVQIFDYTHGVWRDLFSGLKPKRFPFSTIPTEMDLSIPMAPELHHATEIEVEVHGTSEEPEAPPQPELPLDNSGPVQEPPAKKTGVFGTYMELISKLDSVDAANKLWLAINENTRSLTMDEMNILAKEFTTKRTLLATAPATSTSPTQESVSDGKVSKKTGRGTKGRS